MTTQYIVDEKGDKSAVILSIEEYGKLLEDMEELESIKAYDVAKASGDEIIPFEQAVEFEDILNDEERK